MAFTAADGSNPTSYGGPTAGVRPTGRRGPPGLVRGGGRAVLGRPRPRPAPPDDHPSTPIAATVIAAPRPREGPAGSGKDAALGHLPSGKFTANAHWFALAALAHSLTRGLGARSRFEAGVRAAKEGWL
ncbi:hypothetical protein ACWD4X_26335 [Streptomyces termitum]